MADARLYAILARERDSAVIFRRGPSKRVLLVAWDLTADRFQEGQWLNGRIYERRCDLSPNGELLLYFAATYRPPFYSWSAVSRPPFLTALALWPKGDGWGGGGHFLSNEAIALNHRQMEMAPGEGFELPASLSVVPFGKGSGWGEDDPVWFQRLERDGWMLVSRGSAVKHGREAKVWIEFNPPIIWEKPNRAGSTRSVLRMSIKGIHQRNRPWYLTEHDVVPADGEPLKLGDTEWAEWSRSGDLLFARGPRLYRLSPVDGALAPLQEAREIADFSQSTFEPREAPQDARRWPGQ